MTDHENGISRVLYDFEHVPKMEYSKLEQDKKYTASTFVSELASIKQDVLEAYSYETTISSGIEKAQPSAESVPRVYQDQDPTGTSKSLFPFASLDKPAHVLSKWKL